MKKLVCTVLFLSILGCDWGEPLFEILSDIAHFFTSKIPPISVPDSSDILRQITESGVFL